MLLDWSVADLLVGASGQGDVYRSSDAGETGHRVTGPAGDLQALDVTPSSWYVATDAAIFRSTEDGRSWRSLSRP